MLGGALAVLALVKLAEDQASERPPDVGARAEGPSGALRVVLAVMLAFLSSRKIALARNERKRIHTL